jgi:serine/threonine-protein kinase
MKKREDNYRIDFGCLQAEFHELGDFAMTIKHVRSRNYSGLGLIIIGLLLMITLSGCGLRDVSVTDVQSSSTDQSTHTPVPTKTVTPVPTQTTIPPTPTLGVGSTMAAEKDGAILVYVPEGEFTMGSEDARKDARPAHLVYLDAFWIDQTEVTNKQYAMCVADGGCKPPLENRSETHSDYFGNSEFDDYPVIFADWDRANAYCSWADRRLPTEAEWEKAARGTGQTTLPWGESLNCSYANINYYGVHACVGDTTLVGSYPKGKSPYGADDMIGNVWEWVNDIYVESYYQESPSANPPGPESGNFRVMRGGSWNQGPYSVFYRERFHASYSSYISIGFRCAVSATP